MVAFAPSLVLAQDAPNSLKSIVNPAEAIPQALPKPEPAAAPAEQTPEELAKTADLLLRVAQLMLVRLEGTTGPNPNDRQLLDQIQIGGVILPQLLPPESVGDYITSLRRPRGPGALPLMIGLDFVGGGQEATGVRAHGMRVPAMLTVAAGGAGSHSSALFTAQANDVARLGADFHWGPSLALAATPAGTSTGWRTFGSSPDLVAALSSQMGTAFAARNLAWIPVGFPGGTKSATENSPAVLVTPVAELRGNDLKPYEAAIAAGADLVHVGTTLAPTLDPARPACLSPVVIRDVLRGALEFDGLVVAGPMDSPDISRISDTSTSAVEALMSGADMIFWSGSGPRVARAIVDIVQAVQSGALPESLVNDAFVRVTRFKESRGLRLWPMPDKADIRKLAKEAAKRREAADAEQRAITLLQNRGEVLPLSEESSGMIGVTGAFGVEQLRDALQEYFRMVAMQPIRTARHTTRVEDFEVNRLTRPGSPVNTAILIFTRDIELQSQLRVIRGLKQQGQRIVAVLLGFPSDLAAYAEADALVLAYGDAANPDETMTALAEVLVGNAPVAVLPPLRDLELAAGASVTFDVHDVVRTPVGRLPVSFKPPFVAGYAVSYRSDVAFDSVAWDFGDGKESRDAVTTHAYAKPGVYTVALRVGRKGPSLAEGSFRVVVK